MSESHELPITGRGNLLITDVAALFQSPPPVQFPREPFNAAHVIRVLELGDYPDEAGVLGYHVVTNLPAPMAHALLDGPWRVFFAHYGATLAPIHALVTYKGPENTHVFQAGYGSQHCEVFARVSVYGAEYWAEQGNSDPARADWSDLLRRQILAAPPLMSCWLKPGDLESRLAEGLPYVGSAERLLLVRPSAADPGFTVRAFRTVPQAIYEDGV